MEKIQKQADIKTTYERTPLTEALPVNDAGVVETKIKIEKYGPRERATCRDC
nr:hypothetical protein [Escherichia coli]